MIIAATTTLRLDLELLQDQKRWLIKHMATPQADGLLSLIDALQDQIYETGQAGELEVFGNL